MQLQQQQKQLPLQLDIIDIIDDDDDNYPFDTEDRFKDNANHWLDSGYYCYYFGNGDDGSMKTNKQNNEIDGDTFSFFFNKSGNANGGESWLEQNDDKLNNTDKYDEYYDVNNKAAKDAGITYKLVNTSGTVQKNKNRAKDGDDRCYDQSGYDIESFYVES